MIARWIGILGPLLVKGLGFIVLFLFRGAGGKLCLGRFGLLVHLFLRKVRILWFGSSRLQGCNIFHFRK